MYSIVLMTVIRITKRIWSYVVDNILYMYIPARNSNLPYLHYYVQFCYVYVNVSVPHTITPTGKPRCGSWLPVSVAVLEHVVSFPEAVVQNPAALMKYSVPSLRFLFPAYRLVV